MCKHFSLPGIRSIAYIEATSLPSELAMQSIAGLSIMQPIGTTDFPFHGEATCECTQTNVPGTSESVELSFSSLVELPTDRHLALLVIDANNIPYLVGTREDHPSIERVQSFGNPEADANTYTYTVQVTAPRALIRCTPL